MINKNLLNASQPPLDPITSFLNRQQASKSVLSDIEIYAHKYLYSEFVKYNLWDKFLEIYTYSGSNMTGVTQKFKYIPGKTSVLTNMGSMTYASNYIAGQGIRPNGTNQYFKTGIFDNDLGDSGGFLVYQAEDDLNASAAGTRAMMGTTVGGSLCCKGLITGTTTQFCFIWATGGSLNINVPRAINYKGFYYGQRVSPSEIAQYDNGIQSNNSLITRSLIRGVAELQIFAAANSNFHNKSQGFTAVTNGTLSQQDIDNAHRIIALFLNMVGRLTRSSEPLIVNFGYGQSLSLGTSGSPPLSTTQPYTNKMMGLVFLPSALGAYLLPMVEGGTETIQCGTANMFSSLVRIAMPGETKYDYVASAQGQSGTAVAGLTQGTAPYINVMIWLQKLKRIADLYYTGMVVDKIDMMHGEADVNSTTYSVDIQQLATYFNADIKALTGQTSTIPLLFSQISSWTSTSSIGGSHSVGVSPYQLYAAAKANPTLIKLIGAKYHLTYSADALHLQNNSYRQEGEMYGIFYYKYKFISNDIQPLWPLSVTNTGTSIDILMNVPDAQITFDTALISDPGNYGLEIFSGTGGTAIISAIPSILADYNAVAKTQTVRVPYTGTLGTGAKIRYAYTGIPGNASGPVTGVRGCMKSANTTYTSLNGYNLDYWCVHFEEIVP